MVILMEIVIECQDKISWCCGIVYPKTIHRDWIVFDRDGIDFSTRLFGIATAYRSMFQYQSVQCYVTGTYYGCIKNTIGLPDALMVVSF